MVLNATDRRQMLLCTRGLCARSAVRLSVPMRWPATQSVARFSIFVERTHSFDAKPTGGRDRRPNRPDRPDRYSDGADREMGSGVRRGSGSVGGSASAASGAAGSRFDRFVPATDRYSGARPAAKPRRPRPAAKSFPKQSATELLDYTIRKRHEEGAAYVSVCVSV